MVAAVIMVAAAIFTFFSSKNSAKETRKKYNQALQPLTELTDQVGKLVDINQKLSEANVSMAKMMSMNAFYIKTLQATVSAFSDAVNKCTVSPDKTAFKDIDEVERYRISLVDEYMGQGMTREQAEVLASSDVTASITGESIRNFGVNF